MLATDDVYCESICHSDQVAGQDAELLRSRLSFSVRSCKLNPAFLMLWSPPD